ncbi:proteasome accessory factor PafA2 family protein [Luteococcus peritonei]|uniref:Proteasome accessory factor PafA2 family protein n=1 Tax=Luteococcus peritonei TaxID=88874 RepID=A0ABW4RSP3_9ACTN
MRRVRGLETEYGLQVRVETAGLPEGRAGRSAGWRRLGSDEAAHLLFAPVVEANAATNVYLRNGGRLYLDVGSHPEYATAECSSLTELLAQDRAGDLVLDRLAERAEQALTAEGRQARVSVFKNNVDSHANSYGSHENYQVSRTVAGGELEDLVGHLTAFLVTRQLVCGAGHWSRDRMGVGCFLVSQRAEHMWDPMGSATTRSRPMVNTRDEPHADAERFRRLHVIVGDSTMLEPTTLVRIGATELVLRVLESGRRLDHLVVREPGRVIREVAADITGRTPVTSDGMAAVAVQRHCWELAAEHADDEELREAHRLWGRVLEAIEDQALERVEREVDWVAKRRLLLAQAERHRMRPDDPRLAQLDLAWHDVRAGRGLARVAEARGQVERCLTDGAAEVAVDRPPATTRAVLRSRFVEAAQRHRRSFGVDWMRFSCHDLEHGTVVVPDPLATTDQAVDELLERMATEPRAAGSASFRSSRGPGASHGGGAPGASGSFGGSVPIG